MRHVATIHRSDTSSHFQWAVEETPAGVHIVGRPHASRHITTNATRQLRGDDSSMMFRVPTLAFTTEGVNGSINT
jgi:hypothetical protein